jgi:hypothetical protein
MIDLWLVLAGAAAQELPDRSHPPDVPLPALVELPELVVDTANVPMDLLAMPTARRTFIALVLHRGELHLGPSGAGVSFSAMDSLWGVASESRDAETLERLRDELDLKLSLGVGNRAIYAWTSARNRDLGVAVDTLRELLLHPVFPRSELQQHQRGTRQWWIGALATSTVRLPRFDGPLS